MSGIQTSCGEAASLPYADQLGRLCKRVGLGADLLPPVVQQVGQCSVPTILLAC
jgi:hypothetical protein